MFIPGLVARPWPGPQQNRWLALHAMAPQVLERRAVGQTAAETRCPETVSDLAFPWLPQHIY
eukprot:3343268-Lingulodinium_polyedra.AAC.1